MMCTVLRVFEYYADFECSECVRQLPVRVDGGAQAACAHDGGFAGASFGAEQPERDASGERAFV